jgi:hypothetical protein
MDLQHGIAACVRQMVATWVTDRHDMGAVV